MEVFDLVSLAAEPHEKRNVNVFFQNDLFKTRMVSLEEGGKIPPCVMESYVMFYVIKGEVLLKKGSEVATLHENQLFISEPATLAMESVTGARLLGIQIRA
jgi:quercetin dioxygenase-like cupin family protein